MPVNFPANKPPDHQNVLAGTPQEQITAVRDVLMNFPSISALPINRQWNPDTMSQATGDKK
jgi:hypothetical protein